MDNRLDQVIAVTEKGARLAAVLERVAKKTGVPIDSNGLPLRNMVVVVHYAGTLKGFMDALTEFFAVGKDHKARWDAIATEKGTGYILERDRKTRDTLDDLLKERQATLVQGMNQAVGSGNRWVKHLAALTEAERLAIYSGQPVTHHADHFGGPAFLKEVLVRDASNWSDNVTVTYQMKGRSPLTRIFVRRFSDPKRSDVAEEGFALIQLCPNLDPARQQKEWRLHFGDPAPSDTRKLTIPKTPVMEGAPPCKEITRRDLLLMLAEKAEANLIADDFGQTIDESRLRTEGTLAELLDSACQFLYGGGQDTSTNHGSFWRKCGDVYLVRSLAWPEEEQ